MPKRSSSGWGGSATAGNSGGGKRGSGGGGTRGSSGKANKKRKEPFHHAILCLECGFPLPPYNKCFCDVNCKNTWTTGKTMDQIQGLKRYG